MNRKGQILVMFIILLPLILLIAAYAVDMGLVMYEKNRLEGINDNTINYSMEHFGTVTEEEIRELIDKNDQQIIAKIVIGEDRITIMLEKRITSVFGNLIGIKNYQVKSIKHGII